MKHQTGKDFSFDDKMIDSVLVFKIIVHEFTGNITLEKYTKLLSYISI